MEMLSGKRSYCPLTRAPKENVVDNIPSDQPSAGGCLKVSSRARKATIVAKKLRAKKTSQKKALRAAAILPKAKFASLIGQRSFSSDPKVTTARKKEEPTTNSRTSEGTLERNGIAAAEGGQNQAQGDGQAICSDGINVYLTRRRDE